jgi:predicted O-methyltransferase YrrM
MVATSSLTMTRRIIRGPIRNALAVPLRIAAVARHVAHQAGLGCRWLVTSKETTNYTYELTERGLDYIVEGISVATGAGRDRLKLFAEELLGDHELAAHVIAATRASDRRGTADLVFRPGRRIGWYVLARALKPSLIVETGVDKGLGSVILCAALLRNRAEGADGRYIGTDINPAAGYLLSGKYAEAGQILFGDSLESLATIAEPIGLFINDSDHSADYEAREYRAISGKLSKRAVVVGDNAQDTSELLDFARSSGRRFLFIQEFPKDHWFPGCGLGLAFSS